MKHRLLKRMLLTSAGSQGVHPITVCFTHCAVLVSHDAVITDSCGGLSADIITLVGGSISETQNIPIWSHTMVNVDIHVHDANSAATWIVTSVISFLFHGYKLTNLYLLTWYHSIFMYRWTPNTKAWGSNCNVICQSSIQSNLPINEHYKARILSAINPPASVSSDWQWLNFEQFPWISLPLENVHQKCGKVMSISGH